MSAIPPLHFLIFRGSSIDIIAQFLERNKDVVNCVDQYKNTPLHMAAYRGLTDVIDLLCSHGADVLARDVEMNGVMHAVSGSGDVLAAKCLLRYGAPVNIHNSRDFTPIDWCAEYCPLARKFAMTAILEEALRNEIERSNAHDSIFSAIKSGNHSLNDLTNHQICSPEYGKSYESHELSASDLESPCAISMLQRCIIMLERQEETIAILSKKVDTLEVVVREFTDTVACRMSR